MSRTLVILRHTFREAVVQPVFGLLLAAGAAVVGVYALLPFFTQGEDATMFLAVGVDVVLVIALLLSLFAASRTVHEEIEDRTMLTLMSKPIGRGEVLVGKFLGLLLAAGVAVAVLGAALAVAAWLRIPGDYSLPSDPIRTAQVERLSELRRSHLAGLAPQLTLAWMQVGVLVAVAVAISTRFGLVVALPATIVLYLAGNLTRFVDAAADGGGFLAESAAFVVNTVLPFLRVFDLNDRAIYSPVAVAGSQFADDPNAATVAGLWAYVGVAAGYFVAYTAFVLLVAAALFRRRDLGGNEG